jgi:hypothetical protein
MTPAAEAGAENNSVIAALKRCATQNHEFFRGGLNFLEPRLAESHTTIIIPFDDCVIFVRLLHCAKISSRHSEVAQTLDAISGIQFLIGGGGIGERWLPGTVRVRCRP